MSFFSNVTVTPAIAAVAFLILLGCGNQQQGTKPFGYTFSGVEGCRTGNHTFNSIADLCAALQNEATNNFCAQEQRRQEFIERCPNQAFNPVFPPREGEEEERLEDFYSDDSFRFDE